jgi:hypothetical protein
MLRRRTNLRRRQTNLALFPPSPHRPHGNYYYVYYYYYYYYCNLNGDLTLTISFHQVEFEKGASSADVKSALEGAGIEEAFAATTWGKKINNKKKRAALTDFERYKVMVARQKRAKIIKAAM